MPEMVKRVIESECRLAILEMQAAGVIRSVYNAPPPGDYYGMQRFVDQYRMDHKMPPIEWNYLG